MKRLAARTHAEVTAALPHVIEHLAADGLIAYPTETVYGFGSAVTAAATAKLRKLKRREALKPILLLISDPDQAPGVQWSDTARIVADRFWPGPLTLALPAATDAFPPGIVSGDGTVALRASSHPFVRALTAAWGGPITSTSANAPGTAPALRCDAVLDALQALGARNVLLLDGGELPESAPSTIVAVEDRTVRVLRAGAVTMEQLQQQMTGIGINVR